MDVLRRGFSTDVRSGEIDVKANVRTQGKVLRVDAFGPFESTGPTTMPRAEIELSLSGPLDPVDVTVVTTKDNGYVVYEGAPFELGRDLWRKLMAPADDAPKTFGELGIEPERWVTDATVEGPATLSGVKTTEVSGTVDVKPMLEDYNALAKAFPGTEPLSRDEIATAVDKVSEVDFRAWVDDDGILRRFATNVAFDDIAVRVDMRLEQPNEPVEIRTPADAQPISELLRLLGVPPDALLGPGAQLPVPG